MFSTWFRPKPLTVLIAGNDSAGKTTLLYCAKLGKIVPTAATFGFSCSVNI